MAGSQFSAVLSSSKPRKAVAQLVMILIVVAVASYLISTGTGGVHVYNVYPTISMLPTLEVGDLVLVHSVPFDAIKEGDVIVFARPDSSGVCTSASEIIVHRVVNITAQGLITQGDDRSTNPVPDETNPSWPPVPASCVKGIVVVAIPYLGRITETFPPPSNYVLVAAILLVVLAVELRARPKRQSANG